MDGWSARADRQENFLAERVFELLELQRRFALVAKHFEDGRTTLLRHFHAAIFQMDHVHLQRFDLKVPVIAAIWTGQRHERYPFQLVSAVGAGRRGACPRSQEACGGPRWGRKPRILILCNGGACAKKNRPKFGDLAKIGRKYGLPAQNVTGPVLELGTDGQNRDPSADREHVRPPFRQGPCQLACTTVRLHEQGAQAGREDLAQASARRTKHTVGT
jgi:hypothetical protein